MRCEFYGVDAWELFNIIDPLLEGKTLQQVRRAIEENRKWPV